MLRRQGNADTCGDVDLIAFNIEGLRDDLDNAACKRAGIIVLVILPVLYDGELVTTQPRQHVGFSKRSLEAHCGFTQQRIANSVPQGVIDMLEAIKIQQYYGKRFAAPPIKGNGFFYL